MLWAKLKIARKDNYELVYLKGKETTQHTTILGKPGGGKTVLLLNMIRQLARYPVSVILIEPHGEISREARHFFETGKLEYISIQEPKSLNFMKLPYDVNTRASIGREITNQFTRITTEKANQATTVKMNRLQDYVYKSCMDKGVPNLLQARKELEKVRQDKEAREGLLSRWDNMLLDERTHPIICGDDPVEIGRLSQSRKSLIVDTSTTTPEISILLGNLVSQQIKAYYTFQRPENPKPVYVILDECHNYMGNVQQWSMILKESRKFLVSVIACSQDAILFDQKLWRALLNLGTLISFRVGHKEASDIGREMNLPAQALQELPEYHIAYQTPSDKGIAKTLKPPYVPKHKPVKYKSKNDMNTIKGFPIDSYQPSTDYKQGKAVSAIAQWQGAEIPPSSNDDG